MTNDHNLFGPDPASEASKVQQDFIDNWPTFCKSLDIPLAAVRDCEAHIVVAVMLIRMEQRRQEELMALKAQVQRIQGLLRDKLP